MSIVMISRILRSSGLRLKMFSESPRFALWMESTLMKISPSCTLDSYWYYPQRQGILEFQSRSSDDNKLVRIGFCWRLFQDVIEGRIVDFERTLFTACLQLLGLLLDGPVAPQGTWRCQKVWSYNVCKAWWQEELWEGGQPPPHITVKWLLDQVWFFAAVQKNKEFFHVTVGCRPSTSASGK